jgi:hypothetical protein
MDTEFGTETRGDNGVYSGRDVEHREGRVARNIEKETAKLPSDLFLWAAGAAILGSLTFQVLGMRREVQESKMTALLSPSHARAPLSTFIGMWVPSLLLLGVYNKIVKVAGSDRISR